jgi:murein tripeptide amidase MpaA
MLERFDISFDHYHDHEEMTEFLKDCEVNYTGLTKLESIGKFLQGRDLWMLIITNFENGDAGDKPGMWIDGNTHAGEVTGCEVSLYTIKHLLENYGSDPSITQLLDDRAFYVLPRVDPDGAELYLKSPYRRTGGARYYPMSEEEWREQRGLYPEDVNGDGEITLMRIRDPIGDWKISEKDPRIMVKRGPDEGEGIFYRIYPEGLLMNYDGGGDRTGSTQDGFEPQSGVACQLASPPQATGGWTIPHLPTRDQSHSRCLK